MKNPVKYTQFEFNDASLEAEALSAKSELLVPLLVEAEPFGFWSIDAKTGDIWWSEEVYRIHGMKPAKSAPSLSKAMAFYHPSDARIVEKLVGEAIANRKGFDYVFRLLRADGKTRYVQAVASVELEADQSVKTVYGILRDVTKSISDRNVSETRAKLVGSIIANSPAPIAILDRNLCYLQLSPAWARVHGLEDPISYIGKSHYEAMPEIPQAWREDHQRVLQGETVYRTQALKQGEKRETTSASGAAIFPWHTARGEIGGLIIMVTSSDTTQSARRKTASHINSYLEQPDFKSSRYGVIR